MKSLIIILSIFSLISCKEDEPRPLTNERLDSHIKTSIETSWLAVNDQDKSLNKIETQQLFQSLMPIKETVDFKGPFYIELTYQAGHSPTHVLIHIEDEELIYKYGHFTYRGGTPHVLNDLIEKMALEEK